MGEDKIFIAIGAATVLLLLGVIFLAGKMSAGAKVETASDARAQVFSTSYDWGDIGINNGKVDAEFEVKSVGQGTLKLFNGTTSCACTNAVTIVGDKTSPVFGMHSKSDYVAEVSPGQTAKVRATFDPLFHGPNGLGAISRQIILQTNDPQNPTLTFFLTANVTK